MPKWNETLIAVECGGEKGDFGMGVVECRDCRCKFDSQERPLISVVPLDARSFSTYAKFQINQSEATGTQKHQAARNFAGYETCS